MENFLVIGIVGDGIVLCVLIILFKCIFNYKIWISFWLLILREKK